MCSTGDDGVQAAEIREKIKSIGRKCMKCDQTAFIVTRMNDAFCRECFTVYVVHKFRSAIGKSKIVRDGDQVLLLYSGGLASTALLHLVMEGLSERAHKKLRFKPALLHIDETCILNTSSQQNNEKLTEIFKIMKKSGYPCFIASLHQALDITSDKPLCTAVNTIEDLPCDKEDKGSQLNTILSSFQTLTAKQSFIQNLRTQLILSIGKQLGYKKIMSGENNSRIAVNILTDIAEGRGAQLTFKTSFCDDRYKDLMILRPIRDLSVKEIAVYCRMNNLQSVFIPDISTKTTVGSSIERLTEDFVTGLQSNYLSTVSNIVRTGEKLGKSDTSWSEGSCLFCQSPLDVDVGAASASSAVEFSANISTTRQDVTSSSCDALQSQDSPDSWKEVKKKLCYGCRTITSEMGDKNKLPDFIQKRNASNREKMQEVVNEYLLEEDIS